MLRTLLICGLLAGFCAGLLATGFAGSRGARREPGDRLRGGAPAAGRGRPGAELVSRDLQSTLGLLTAAVVYGLALGGLFALAFAWAYGRVSPGAGPARTALWLAALAFASSTSCRSSSTRRTRRRSATPTRSADAPLLYLAMMWISIFGGDRRRADPPPRRRALDAGSATLVALASLRRARRGRGARAAGRPRGPARASRRRRCGASARLVWDAGDVSGRRSGSSSRASRSAR